MDELEAKKQIKKVWVGLGRDPNKLNLSKKNPKQLKEVLTKLKAIKYSFDLLFSPDPGVELAKEMLSITFNKEDGK